METIDVAPDSSNLRPPALADHVRLRADLTGARRQTRRIAGGTAARLIGRTVGAIISLVALHEATRYFGPLRWGPITAALAWFAMFSYLGSPGVATLTMREVARRDSDAGAVFGQGLSAALAVSLLAALASAALGSLVYWGKSSTLLMVLLLAPGIPFIALFLTSGAALVGRGRSWSRSIVDIESSIFLLAATLVVVGAHLSARDYVLVYVGSLVASALAALGLATYQVMPKLHGVYRAATSMLRKSLPLGQFDLLAVVYARADSVMLFFITGSRAVALYGVAFQVAVFLFALPSLLSNALLPDYMSASPARRQFLARRAFDVILTVSLPLPVFGVLFSRAFVVWLAGPRFAQAGPLLAILTIAAAIALVNGYIFQIAVFADAEKRLWRTIGIVTAVNLSANAVAVTLWGATGAAAVMVLSETIGVVLYWRSYRATMPTLLGRRYPLSALLATGGVVASSWGLHAGLGVQVGKGAAIVPRVLVLIIVYLALIWCVSTAARRATRHLSTSSEKGARASS